MSIILTPRWTSSALQLSGSALVNCGTPAVLSAVSSFTLEAWIYPTSAKGMQSVIGNVDNATGGQYQLFLSDGYVVAYVGIAPFVIQSSQALTLNAWHHVAATFDGTSGLLLLYVDGVVVSQGTFRGSLPAGGTSVLIGAVMQQNVPISFFQGQIGRVLIWNTVRDPEAILNDSVQVGIYQALQNPNLIFNADFSVMPTVDSSGNGIALNYVNGAQVVLNVPSVVLGSSGYVDCGSYPDYSFPGTNPYTIEGWFFPTQSTNGVLVSYGDSGGNWEYQLLYQNNQIVGRRNSDSLQIVSSSAVVPWSYYHFALTYDGGADGAKTLSLYVNGNLQSVEYFRSAITAVTGGHVLLGKQYGSESFLNGAIQNLRIWKVCLEQAEIFQWMYNDVIADDRLVSNYDFTVDPPVDTTDNTELSLMGGATQTLQQISLPPTDPVAQLGIPLSINAIYLNQTPEKALPPPPSSSFAEQPEVFSAEHLEASWMDFLLLRGTEEGAGRGDELHRSFQASFAKARKLMEDNPRLARVFTRTDANGMTRIVHHGLRGDTLVYEGAIGAESDCTLWWIQFIFQLTIGFFQALGLLPTTGNIATRVYNLIRGNATVMRALTSLVGKTITAASAIGVMRVIYREGLMWPIIKFALTTAGWYALFWILRKIIAIVTGLEAAAILSGFIVWAAQLTNTSLNYNSKCGPQAVSA